MNDLFKNDLINLQEYEIVPEAIAANETPREMILRTTGHDFLYNPNPLFHHEWTWQEVHEFPPMQQYLTDVLMRFYKPKIILKKREDVTEH